MFGIPHEDWGEEVKAVIEPAEGIEGNDELAARVLAFCGDKLAKLEKHKDGRLHQRDVPRDPNGKLYKRKLRDPYWEGVQRAL